MDKGLLCSALALLIYIGGGLTVFIGIVLLMTTVGKDLGNLGGEDPLGYFLVLIGLALSVIGVIIMKILRRQN